MPRTSSAGFAVAWDGFSSTLYAGLQELQQRSEFVDMTLAADGHLVRVHQVVVGLASPFLKELIRSAPTPHPIIFLNNVSHKVLCCILEYMYTGEVIVPADELVKFIEVGKALNVKGLEELYNEHSDDPIATTTASDDVVEAAATLGRISNVKSLSNESEQLDLSEFIIEDHIANLVQNKTVEQAKLSQPETPNRKHKLSSHDIPEEVTETPSKMLKFIPIQQTTELDLLHDSQQENCEGKMSPLDIVQEDIHESDEDVFTQEQHLERDNFSENVASAQTDTQIFTQTTNILADKPEIMYTISNMGGIQMILNRFMYRMRNKYKDGRRRWQCVNYNLTKCPAMSVTQGNRVLSRTSLHNHPFHDKKIISKANSNLVYASLGDADSAHVKLAR